jgi:hypothetical protein
MVMRDSRHSASLISNRSVRFRLDITSRIANREHGGDRKSKNQDANLHFESPTVAEAARSMNVSRRTVEAGTAFFENGFGLGNRRTRYIHCFGCVR